MRRILVTNDDGVNSPGLVALADALASLGEVTVVAPAQETSAIGHALTLHEPLRVSQVADRWYAVDGTPTDCVNLGIFVVLEGLPDLLVSGINKGLNIGDDVTYSGTVSGALEGTLLGVPSMAVSVEKAKSGWEFGEAARVARDLAQRVLRHGLPGRVLVNVNVPAGKPAGWRVTVQGRRRHSTSVETRQDLRGRTYYWIGLSEDHWLPNARSDFDAVAHGLVSITPLHADLTAHEAMAAIDALAHDGQGEIE